MLRKIKEFLGRGLHAQDGDTGRIDDFYFSEEGWDIPYVVINCGGWLKPKKVLIPPVDFQWKGPEIKETVPVDLSKEEIRTSSEAQTADVAPLSGQHKMHVYYNWPVFWPPLPGVVESSPPPFMEHNNSLVSVRGVEGYSIEAINGKAGHVDDFIVDDRTWALRFMAIDTKNWVPGRHVLVSVSQIDRINWDNAQVSLNMTVEEIKSCPGVDILELLKGGHEGKLQDHFAHF